MHSLTSALDGSELSILVS